MTMKWRVSAYCSNALVEGVRDERSICKSTEISVAGKTVQPLLRNHYYATIPVLCRQYRCAVSPFVPLFSCTMKTSLLRKPFLWMLVGSFVCAVAIAGLHLYLHSNLSAAQKITSDAGLLHENIETSLTLVNAHQSALIEAATLVRLDPRALGAAIVARRSLTAQPIVSDFREYAGLSESVGLARVCVSSTEAAFRVVFSPTASDSILYYSRHSSLTSRSFANYSLYDEARVALRSYRHLRGAELKNVLRQNTSLNLLAAALITKQALVRFERENTTLDAKLLPSFAGALYHDAADYPFPSDTPITMTQEADNFGQLVGLLYTRADLMP